MGVKSDRRQNAQCDEDREHGELSDDKGGLRLRRRQRLQERQLLERLRDANKDIEVKRRNCAADVDPAPSSCETKGIKRSNGYGQQDERGYANRSSRIESEWRQWQSRDARQHGCRKKQRGPATERSSSQQAVQGDEAREDTDQADENMDL